MAQVTVVLVDDHQMVLDSFRRALTTLGDIEVVGVGATAAEGVELAIELRPDVVLMDYGLPDANGASAARTILAQVPDAKILILTGSDYDRVAAAAIDAGCVGYLRKAAPFDKLLAVVHAVAAGEAVFSHEELRRLATNGVSSRLTPREREILDLLGEGLGNQAIAERLTVSLNTVRTHVQTVLAKLGAHSKLEAVTIATKSGLLTSR